jgi:hypothetical protein
MTKPFISQELRRIAEEVTTKRLGTMTASELGAYQQRQQGRGQQVHKQGQQRSSSKGKGAGL